MDYKYFQKDMSNKSHPYGRNIGQTQAMGCQSVLISQLASDSTQEAVTALMHLKSGTENGYTDWIKSVAVTTF